VSDFLVVVAEDCKTVIEVLKKPPSTSPYLVIKRGGSGKSCQTYVASGSVSILEASSVSNGIAALVGALLPVWLWISGGSERSIFVPSRVPVERLHYKQTIQVCRCFSEVSNCCNADDCLKLKQLTQHLEVEAKVAKHMWLSGSVSILEASSISNCIVVLMGAYSMFDFEYLMEEKRAYLFLHEYLLNDFIFQQTIQVWSCFSQISNCCHAEDCTLKQWTQCLHLDTSQQWLLC